MIEFIGLNKTMWKKIINLFVIGLLVYFLIGTFSQNDKRSNRVRLDNNGLSNNALVFPTQSNDSVKEALTNVEKSIKEDDQFQIQFIASNNITYVFSKGILMNLPLTQGRKFTLEEFNADVPLAMVGSNVKDNVYLTQLQNYYRLNDQYISIVGFTGSDETKKLNEKIFISVNSRSMPTNLRLNQVKVVGDGPEVIEHPGHFASIFHSPKGRKFLPSEIPIIGSGWLKHSWVFFLSGIILFIFMVLAIVWQFENTGNNKKKYVDLKNIILDVLIVSVVLAIGIQTKYIINKYILIAVVYLFLLLSIGLGRYLARYEILT